MLREKPERTAQIRFQRAHRPGARRLAADRSVKRRRVERGAGNAPRRPFVRDAIERRKRRRFLRQRLVEEDASVIDRAGRDGRQTSAANLVELHRTHDERIVVQRERRHHRTACGRREQLQKSRVRGRAAVLLRGPAERLEDARWIKDVAPRLFGPFVLDHADDRQIVEVAVPRRLIVEKLHRLMRRRRIDAEGLLFDDPSDGDAKVVDRPRRFVLRRVRAGQCGQRFDNRRPRAALVRRKRILVRERPNMRRPEVEQKANLL